MKSKVILVLIHSLGKFYKLPPASYVFFLPHSSCRTSQSNSKASKKCAYNLPGPPSKITPLYHHSHKLLLSYESHLLSCCAYRPLPPVKTCILVSMHDLNVFFWEQAAFLNWTTVGVWKYQLSKITPLIKPWILSVILTQNSPTLYLIWDLPFISEYSTSFGFSFP